MTLSNRKDKRLRTLASILDGVCGVVLVYAGFHHVVRPGEFCNAVSQYQVLPSVICTVVGMIVPYAELGIGINLLFGYYAHYLRMLSICLFSVFVACQAKALILGEVISCGCFGNHSSVVSKHTIALPIVLFCLAVVSALLERSRQRSCELRSQ